MASSSVTVSSATTSNPIRVNHYSESGLGIGFGVVVNGGGTLTYKVQHTFDNLSTTPTTWFDHPTVTGKSADSDGNYSAKITAIRLNVTAYTSGSATLTVVQ